jgi:uncharacterized protein (TIGR03790 family)
MPRSSARCEDSTGSKKGHWALSGKSAARVAAGSSRAMLTAICLLAVGCSSAPKTQKPLEYKAPAKWAATQDGYRTLVVYNKEVPGSQALAEYYAVKRGLPPENIIRTATLASESIDIVEVTKNICGTIKAQIKHLKTINRRIDYIVLCKGTAIRSWEGKDAFGIDSYIAAMAQPDPPSGTASQPRMANPYYGKDEPFNSDKFGMYLVTRLDGYTFEDAKRLVDNSLAAKPHKGPFLLDSDPGRRSGGYKPLEDSMATANKEMTARGFKVTYEETKSFVPGGEALAGYASWGSNDQGFSQSTYERIKFLPGAIAETFVSTSARTFQPTSGGQSLVTDLIKSGVTGIKGYVNEPYAVALAQPHILFDRYTKGRTLAESFYAASPLLRWRDVVIGDPLCAPYKK